MKIEKNHTKNYFRSNEFNLQYYSYNKSKCINNFVVSRNYATTPMIHNIIILIQMLWQLYVFKTLKRLMIANDIQSDLPNILAPIFL